MSIRTLSLTLNLDTGTFSTNARNATTAMKDLAKSLDDTGRRARANAAELDGSIRSLRNYVENGLRLKQTQDQIRASQDQFVKGLVRELDTMGMNAQQLKAYTAAQLGLTAQTRELLEALDEKARSLKAVADAEAAEAAASREAAEADAQRLEDSEALLNTMREQIVTLRGGAEALAMEKAEALGCAEEFRTLAGIVNNLKAEHAEAAETIRAFAEAEAMARKEALEEASAQDRVLSTLQRQIVSMREQIILTNEGAAALAKFRAEEAGVSEAAAPMIAEIEVLDAQMKKLRHSTGGASGAIVEANRIMHEATRGALTQMTGSITILLNRLGAAGGLTLAVGVTIGMLHAMLKPTLDQAKAMEELARQTQALGMSFHDIEDLQVVADLTGLKLEKLTGGIGRLDAAFGRARQGSKNTAAAFKELGVDLSQNYSSEDLLKKVAEGMSRLPDGATKAKLAMDLFGRSGREMIPVLDGLAEKLRLADQLADEYGVHNEAAVKAALALAGAQNENKIAMDGLSKVFMQSMGPILTNVVQGFSDLARAFVDSYKAGTGAKLAMDIFAGALKGIVSIVAILGVGIYDLFVTLDAVAHFIVGTAATGWGVWQAMVVGAVSAVARLVSILDDLVHFRFGDAQSKWSGFFQGIASDAGKAGKKSIEVARQQFGLVDGDVNKIADANGNTAQFLENLWGDKTKKYPQLGTTTGAGDSSGDGLGSGRKNNPATNLVNELKAQIADLNADLVDGDTHLAKYQERMNNLQDPLGQAVQGHAALRAEIEKLAIQLDDLDKKKKAKAVYDELKKGASEAAIAAKQAHDNLVAVIAGASPEKLSEINRRAADAQRVKDAALYKDGSGLANQKDTDQQSAANDTKDAKSLQSFQDKLFKARATSAELWSQYDAGVTRAQTATAALKVELDKAILDAHDPATRQALENIGKDLLPAAASVDAAKAADDFRTKTKKINAELAGDTLEKQREIVANEAKAAYDRIASMDLTTERGKEAYAEYVNYVDALSRKANAETPWGKMAQEWGDLTGNMQKQSAEWMNSFVEDLSKGKMNFGQFTTKILEDMSQMIMKALIANTIIKPLMSALGVNVSAGGAGGMSVNGLSGGGFLGSLGSLFGSGGGGGGEGFAGADLSSVVGLFHGGGLVGSGGMTRSADPRMFMGAWKYHTGGVAGLAPNEVPAILQRGEGVFTQQQMRDMARGGQNSGAPPVSINLNNQSGVPLDADHAGTKFDGEKYVLDVVVSHLSRPGALRNAIKSQQ